MSARLLVTAAVLLLALAAPAQANVPAQGGNEAEEAPGLEQLIATLDVDPARARPDLEELRRATQAVAPAEPAPPAPGLELRRPRPVREGKVRLREAFAARAVVIDQGRCEARPVRLIAIEEQVFPSEPISISVCARLDGGPTRPVEVRAAITTGRGKVLAAQRGALRFGAGASVDHVVRFPAVTLPETGVYRYIVDVDGERVANLPLFEVHAPPPGF